MPELMKGHSWSDRYLKDSLRKEVTFPAVVEEKIDDIRCHFKLIKCQDSGKPVAVEALSYAGKPLHNLQYECEKVYSLLLALGIEELDCGIECNGNFNDSYRLVRSSKGIPEDLVGAPVRVMLFDVPFYGALDYMQRNSIMVGIVGRAQRMGLRMVRPEYVLVNNEEEAHAAYLYFRGKGREGGMYKSLHSLYLKGKRIYGWLKMKPEETYDGQITRINQAHALDGTPHDRAGSVSVAVDLPGGQSATADPSGLAHDLAADMWRNPDAYIGKWIEFKCMERDRQGGFRHPIFIRMREDKK